MKSFRFLSYPLLVFLLILGLIGCSSTDENDADANNNDNLGQNTQVENVNNNNNNDNDIPEDQEEITLTVLLAWMIGEDRWEEYYKKPAEEKFPHITLERVMADAGDREALEELFSEGVTPDLIMLSHPSQINLLQEYELAYDMSELIEKHDFDLLRYDDDYFDEWLSWTGGEIWSLPFVAQKYALHYNKDIFDLFGEEYPSDDMTWDEVLELAARMTTKRDGEKYEGIYMQHDASQTLTQVIGDTLFIDPETEEVLWTEREEVREYLAMLDRMMAIPDIELEVESEGIHFIEAFQTERTLAMLPHQFLEALPDDMNWDVATYPTWPDAPGIQPNQSGWALGLTAISEHKDEAFKVLDFWYSDEQILSKGNSAVTTPFNHLFETGAVEEALKNDPYRPHLADLNIDALFKNSPSGGTTVQRSEFDAGAQEVIGHIGFEYEESEEDWNTFLRRLKEEEEARIAEEKGSR